MSNPNPPPADEDFSRSFGGDTEVGSELSADESGQQDATTDNEPDTLLNDSGLTTRQEIRELQRLMLEVARTDEFGSARASAARAYRDLEVLRCAKRGKPLLLTLSAKAELPKPSPAITVTPTIVPKAA